MVIKLIVNKPLKPSIKLAPFITKKNRSTNIEENIWLDIKELKWNVYIHNLYRQYEDASKKKKYHDY